MINVTINFKEQVGKYVPGYWNIDHVYQKNGEIYFTLFKTTGPGFHKGDISMHHLSLLLADAHLPVEVVQ